MKKILLTAIFLLACSPAYSAVELDGDANGATDISKGGTNATTAANARISLGVAAALGSDDNYVTDAEKTRLGDLEAADSVSFAGVQATGAGGLKAGTENSVRGAITLYSNVNPYAFGVISAATPTSTWSLAAPPGPPAGANYLFNVDADGTGGFTDPATFQAATITASGFDGNLATTDDTLQEIAQKLDDLSITGGYTNLTSFIAQTAWRIFYSDGSGDVKELALGADGEYLKSNGASLAPSWATPSGAAHDAVTLDANLGNNLLGLSTQQLTLDSQTQNYVFASPNGSSGVPSFRALVAADVPTLNQNTSGTAAGLSGTPNITVGIIGAGGGGFAVDADGDTTVKSLNQSKTSGSAGDLGLYEANSTDTHGAGWRGPASITGDGAYRGQFANARATSANMVQAWTNVGESGSGTAVDPYVQTLSWLDLDSYQTSISFGANVQTALGVAIGSAGAPVLFNGAGGTPTSLTLTNAVLNTGTSLPGTCIIGQLFIDTDADTNGQLYSCVATNTWKDVDDDGGAGGMATTDIDLSSELDTIVGDNVGSGYLVFNTTPTFVTSIAPTSADGATLGTTALEWSDIYLAAGGVIYGENGQENSLTSSATGWTANLDFTITGSDLTLGAAGVKLTGDGDGAITLLGLGDGSDESITINLDDVSNVVGISTATGVTAIRYDMAIQAPAVFNSYTAAQTLTAAAHNATLVQMTTADEVTMWDCETANVGQYVVLWARDAEKIEVVPASGDQFYLFNGTGIGANDELDMVATAGTKITLMCTAANVWSVLYETSACADGGAAD